VSCLASNYVPSPQDPSLSIQAVNSVEGGSLTAVGKKSKIELELELLP